MHQQQVIHICVCQSLESYRQCRYQECMPYLQGYYADTFKGEAVIATLDRMTKWRDDTVAALLADDETGAEAEAEYISSGEGDEVAYSGESGDPMEVDEESPDDESEELPW